MRYGAVLMILTPFLTAAAQARAPAAPAAGQAAMSRAAAAAAQLNPGAGGRCGLDGCGPRN